MFVITIENLRWVDVLMIVATTAKGRYEGRRGSENREFSALGFS